MGHPPVPLPHHPHSKECLDNILHKSTLITFKTIAIRPVNTCLCQKFFSGFLIGPVWVLESYNKVSLESALFQAEHPQISQPFFIEEILQSYDKFCDSPLHLLQQFPVCAGDPRAGCSMAGGV